MPLSPLLLVALVAMMFSVPGPCAFDPHPEYDCEDGQECPAGMACATDGYCKEAGLACLNGEQLCDGRCLVDADFDSSSEHCGACGQACADDAACCGGSCTPIGTDDDCSTCDDRCGVRELCVDRSCQSECDVDRPCAGATERCCDGLCKDVAVNREHCGACNIACEPNEACSEESCVIPASTDCCGAACAQCADGQTCGGDGPATSLTCRVCTVFSDSSPCPGDETCLLTSAIADDEGVCVASVASPANEFGACSPPAGGQPNPCAPGLVCATAHCMAPCLTATASCRCIPFDDGNGGATAQGLCFPECGSDLACPAGFHCTVTGACLLHQSSPIAADGDCSQERFECADGLGCEPGSWTCKPLCSTAVPCTTGTCVYPFSGSSPVGVCQP